SRKQVLVRVFDNLLLAELEQILEGVVDQRVASLGVLQIQGGGRVIKDGLQASLVFAERIICSLLFLALCLQKRLGPLQLRGMTGCQLFALELSPAQPFLGSALVCLGGLEV